MSATPTKATTRRYRVTVTAHDADRGVAQAREHVVAVNLRRGGGAAGPNAVEMLLSALGTCLLTNVQALAAKMRLPLTQAWVTLEGVRQERPPCLVSIRYTLHLRSPAPAAKLRALHEKAVAWGTVARTLQQGVPLEAHLDLGTDLA